VNAPCLVPLLFMLGIARHETEIRRVGLKRRPFGVRRVVDVEPVVFVFPQAPQIGVVDGGVFIFLLWEGRRAGVPDILF